MEIILEGQPKSTQHCYLYSSRGGSVRGYMASQCKALKEDYQWQTRSQFKGEPLTGPLSVTMTIYHGDKRVRDIDNYNKLVFDAMSGIVYEDDGQIETLTITKRYDKKRPRIEILVVQSPE